MSNLVAGYCGPKFNIESDTALIVLGTSERKETGELFARTLDARKIFEKVDVVTLNRAAAVLGRKALQEQMKRSTVITHSAGITRVREALQVIAINAPEHVSFFQLLKRASEVTKDPVTKEPGSHQTGLGDMAQAGLELLRSPISTVVTPTRIARGYSTSQRLMHGKLDFPAGRALVHTFPDTFGFIDAVNESVTTDYSLPNSGVSYLAVPDQYHNDILFSPGRSIDAMTPFIFPRTV
ncbi:MAG: hypothetical protein M3Q70_03150 [bacterium]|nr:hypothetical protein [bacterium]